MTHIRVFRTTHARHDPATCLAPGLFRNFRKGDRKRTKLDITYEYGEETIRFVGFEPLNAQDLKFLQAIVALAATQKILLDAEPQTDVGRKLRLLLDPRLDAADKGALVVCESFSGLLAELGLSASGKNIKTLKASLHRMANITVIVKSGPREASFHLLSYALDEASGKLLVALNPRITEAILGRRPYAYIDMPEVRTLRSDAAILIHHRLCGWIDRGKTGRVKIDTLYSYVWADGAHGSALRMRRKKIRQALTELKRLGWTVTEYAEGMFEITRPRRPHQQNHLGPTLTLARTNVDASSDQR